MKLLQSSLFFLFSSVIALTAAQDFVVGDACVFPVVFYVSNACSEFWARPVVNVTADGECNYIPPSRYTDMIGPGPYYRAVCGTDGGTIKYLAAGCSESTCTNCPRWNAYRNSSSGGQFDMRNLQCQDLKISSFVSYGPLEVRADPPSETPAVPVPVPTEPVPVPTEPVPVPTEPVPVPTEPVPAPTVPATPAPVTPQVPCTWQYRYYNRTEYLEFSAQPTCNIHNLVGPQQVASIIADGVCRDSGVSSLQYYQAMCDGNGGVVFLTNKCVDSLCQNCSAVADVYRGVSYASNDCMDDASNPLKAWVLRGTCSLPSCGMMTRSFSLSSP